MEARRSHEMDLQPTEPITGFPRDRLRERFAEFDERPYRADQLLQWVFEKRATSYDEMTNLGIALREKLATAHPISTLELTRKQGSEDTTQKFLFKLRDGRFVETVLIPASPALYGERSDRRTACVSSQVGCAYGCKFCASGLAGFARNLNVSEIVEQLLKVENYSGEKVNNIVFMGMGEPLANLSNLTGALEIINAHWGLNIGARHPTQRTFKSATT